MNVRIPSALGVRVHMCVNRALTAVPFVCLAAGGRRTHSLCVRALCALSVCDRAPSLTCPSSCAPGCVCAIEICICRYADMHEPVYPKRFYKSVCVCVCVQRACLVNFSKKRTHTQFEYSLQHHRNHALSSHRGV